MLLLISFVIQSPVSLPHLMDSHAINQACKKYVENNDIRVIKIMKPNRNRLTGNGLHQLVFPIQQWFVG